MTNYRNRRVERKSSSEECSLRSGCPQPTAKFPAMPNIFGKACRSGYDWKVPKNACEPQTVFWDAAPSSHQGVPLLMSYGYAATGWREGVEQERARKWSQAIQRGYY
eukprot:6201450-Pleurochrysis_carterae.AAC.2